MASSPVLVCTQQTVRDRHSVSVQLQGSYRGSWQLDTTLTILQYYTLKYHSRCSRLLKHNPAAWRLPTLHTWHLFQATRSRRRSHNKAPLVCSLSTLSLSIGLWTGWKENFLRTDGCYLALWLSDTHQLTRLTVLMKTYWPAPVWSLSLPPETNYHNEHVKTKNCFAINIWSSTLSIKGSYWSKFLQHFNPTNSIKNNKNIVKCLYKKKIY